jgi:lysophospholipase L1-like esterase
MSWIKPFTLLLLTVFFQLKLYTTLPLDLSYLSKNQWIFLILYQILFFLSVILIWNRKFILLANTLILLIFINLFTSSLTTPLDNFKTLPPNMTQKIKIEGKVMPNFFGINTISTDKKGFRVTSEIDYLNKNTFRIFAVGASTTEEIYVDNLETWTGLLENKIWPPNAGKVEVINTGLSGLRAKNHLATMKRTEKYFPNLYIFLVGVNDWNKHIKDLVGEKEIGDMTLDNTLLYSGIVKLKQLIMSSIFKLIGNNNSFSKKIDGGFYSDRNNSLMKEDVRKLKINNVDPEYYSNINEIAKKCSQKKYDCLFVTQPTAYSDKISPYLKSRLWMTPPDASYTLDLDSLINISTFYNLTLKKITDKYQLPLCDLANKIPPSEEYFYDDVHFNENGSKKVAEIISECINKLIFNNAPLVKKNNVFPEMKN